MTISFWLVSHIAGAVLTGLLVMVACLSLSKRRHQDYSVLFKSLSGLTLYQTLSGVALGLGSDTSALAFCSRMGLYLFLVGVPMLLLSKQVVDQHKLLWTPYWASVGVTLVALFALP